MLASRAVVFESPKYVQQRGALKHIGQFVRDTFPKAKQAGILIPEMLRERYLPSLLSSIPGDADQPSVVEFDAEVTRSNLNRVLGQLKSKGVDHVIGFGGGKLLDMAKLAANELSVPVVICPSLASTDAPCTALSVIYKDNGDFDEYKFFPRPPDMVIADTEVIAAAPVRFLVAGMGDAMATFYEARACQDNPDASSLIAPLTYRPPRVAMAIAGACLDVLFSCGIQAKADCQQGQLSPAVDEVIEANILLSGLGAESGGLAAAHGFHNALTLLPESHSYMHGEKVAFGTLVQLLLEGNEKEAEKVARFNKAVGLPVTLSDLSIKQLSNDRLQQLVEACLVPDSTCWNVRGLNADKMEKAILGADALGQKVSSLLSEAAPHVAAPYE